MATANAQPDEQRMFQGPQSRFAFDILSFKSTNLPSDSDRVDIYIAVPYAMLEFLYAVDKYVADYGATVQITDRSTGMLVLDKYETYNILESKADHDRILGTRRYSNGGAERADAEQFSTYLVGGKDYDIHLSVRDLSAHRDYDTTFTFRPKDFRASFIALSDLMIYRSMHNNRIVPSIGTDVATLSGDEPGIFAELYNAPPDSTLGIVAEVFPIKPDGSMDEGNSAVRVTGSIHTAAMHDSSRMAPPSEPKVSMFQSIPFDNLWVGRYILHLYILPSVKDTNLRTLAELHARAIASGERNITVNSAHGIPVAAADLDQAIDQLHLIATGTERDSLDVAKTAAQKREAILDFWQRRNPERGGANRPMQIFYARVQYANEHFSGGLSQGWRSDRGRVYVALGPPEYVDSHPYDTRRPPYEVWEYPNLSASVSRRYVFIDRYMLGDYRLEGPSPPSGTFIW
ncbi:MAG TPA: GWxTD domain-containing protein [Candidatus Kapabacteria bacterium]|nr:GWxTD domain-containing protein [Candidatus Kapabacteria bacterium]